MEAENGKNGSRYMDVPYSTVVVPDMTTDDELCYMAYHPELEGCMTHGDTPEEALSNLHEAREALHFCVD